MTKPAKKQSLGRGISAIFGNSPEATISSINDKNADKIVGNIIELELDLIETNPFQPRTSFMSLIHISEPTRLRLNSYAVFCLKKKKLSLLNAPFPANRHLKCPISLLSSFVQDSVALVYSQF